MKSKWTILSVVMFATLTMSCMANAAESISKNPADQTKQLEQATAQFYQSLNTLFTGDVEPMLHVWSHSDDVTYMGPGGGFQVGWKQIQPMWEEVAAMKLGGKIIAEDTHFTISEDLAIVHCREVGSNLDEQGQTVQVSIRATSIFRKEQGNWKMIGHHTDLLPFLDHTATSPVSTTAD